MKTEQNISYKAAKAQFDFAKKGSFSDLGRRGVAPLRKLVEAQTCSQDSEPQPATQQKVSPPANHTAGQKEKAISAVTPPVAAVARVPSPLLWIPWSVMMTPIRGHKEKP